MTSVTSKIKVVHVSNKLIEKAFCSYNLPVGHKSKIDCQTYVKIVSAIMFSSDLKNGYVKV